MLEGQWGHREPPSTPWELRLSIHQPALPLGCGSIRIDAQGVQGGVPSGAAMVRVSTTGTAVQAVPGSLCSTVSCDMPV